MAQLESFRPLYLAATQLEVLIAYADHYKCGSKSKLSNSESYFKWFVHFTKKLRLCRVVGILSDFAN